MDANNKERGSQCKYTIRTGSAVDLTLFKEWLIQIFNSSSNGFILNIKKY